MEELEPIKPLMQRTPKRCEPSKENPMLVTVLEYEEFQNGWDYGEEKDLIGKINKIIERINNPQ